MPHPRIPRRSRFCCDGDCQQGRSCPSFPPPPAPRDADSWVGMFCTAMLVVLVVLLLAEWNWPAVRALFSNYL